MEYQFNLGSAIQPPPFIPKIDPSATMLASVEGSAYPLSGEEVVFQTRGGDEARVLTTQVLMTMDQCRPFRSMDEHISAVVNKVQGLNDHVRVRQGLELLQRQGLLLSENEVLDKARKTDLQPAPLAAACIRACDRPASLERLLDSMAASASQHGQTVPVMILDDSRDEANAARNAELAGAFAAKQDAPVHYIGRAQQDKLARKLRKARPESEATIDRLLQQSAQGFGGGRTWNLALLLTAGRRLFLLDEDFELPLKVRTDAADGVGFGAASAPAAWFYPDPQTALDAGEALDGDPFAAHLAMAGHGLGQIDANSPWAVDREALRGHNLTELRALVEGHRLLSTFNGTRGSSGMADAQQLFLLDDVSRARLCSDREAYLRNLESQNLWHACAGARVVEQGYMTPFALDNSELLPCTRAAGRNEDALFNTLARFCHPDSAGLQLPCTIGHVQEAGRGDLKARIGQRPWRVNVNTFAYETLHSHMGRSLSADPAQRMAFAADIFADVAGASATDRVAHLREYLNYERSDIIARLQKQLMGYSNAPVFWEADVRELIAANAKVMNGRVPPRLEDWPEDIDSTTCGERLAEDMTALAEDLRAWPAMWQWAAEQGENLVASL